MWSWWRLKSWRSGGAGAYHSSEEAALRFLHRTAAAPDVMASIPDDDFESTSPVVGFKIGCGGAVVVCSHKDGQETWLPADMWLPGGFTAAA
jgi:hypothetical protein